MGNIGRKGKGRCSGTILAGAFTVPTVMSAVQQNVVSANLYGANMPKGLTTAVSKSYAKGVSTKYLTKFLRFAAYLVFPAAIAVLTAIGIYQFCKYLTRYNYWKVLSHDENPGYSEAQKCLFWKVLSHDKEPRYSKAQKCLFDVLQRYGKSLGIENTELEVDTGVLLGILALYGDRKKEIENLCKNKERVKISIDSISRDGHLKLGIVDIKKICSTKCFDNKDSKIIECLNKILEQSNKKNKNNVKLVLEGQGGNIFLKATKNKEEKVKMNLSYDGDREVRKIIKLLEDPVIVNDNVGEEDGDFGIWKALIKEKEAPNYYTELDELFDFMEMYGEDLGIKGKKVEVDPEFLLDTLCDVNKDNYLQIREIKEFLSTQREKPVAVYIENILNTGRLEITIEDENKKQYKVNTKYFANSIPGVIKFFNKILEENKDNLELEWDEEKRDILLQQKNTNNKVNVGDYDTADFEDNMKKLLKEGQGDLDNEEFKHWKILKHKEAPVNTPKDQKDLFSFLFDYSTGLNLWKEIEVDPAVLSKVVLLEDKDVEKFLREKKVRKEKVTVSIDKVHKGGYLTLELKNEKMESPYVIDTNFFDNDIPGIIKFFNKIFEQTSEGRIPVLKKENEGIFLEVAGGPRINISKDKDGNYLEKDFVKKMDNSTKLLDDGHWGVLSIKDAPNYAQELKNVLGTLSSLSECYELEVDPSVLLSVLGKDTKKEVEEALKSKENEMVAVHMTVTTQGYLSFKIEEENLSFNTDFFVNNIDKVINFFNKIFEKNMKNIAGIKNMDDNIKPALEKQGEKVLLKAIDQETGRLWGSIEAKEHNANVEEFKKLIEEGPDSHWKVFYENNAPDEDDLDEKKRDALHNKRENLLKGLHSIDQIIDDDTVGIGIKVNSSVLLEALYRDDDYPEVKALLKNEKEVTVKIFFNQGYDSLYLEIPGKEERVFVRTNDFNDDVPGIINFFNKIFEQSKSKIKLKLEEDEKRENVILKAKDKSGQEVSVVFGSEYMTDEDIKDKMEAIRQLPNSPYLKNVNRRENVAKEHAADVKGFKKIIEGGQGAENEG